MVAAATATAVLGLLRTKFRMIGFPEMEGPTQPTEPRVALLRPLAAPMVRLCSLVMQTIFGRMTEVQALEQLLPQTKEAEMKTCTSWMEDPCQPAG